MAVTGTIEIADSDPQGCEGPEAYAINIHPQPVHHSKYNIEN